MILRQIGISDKYVQQSAGDQELAFQRAFTIELITMACFTAVLAAAVPLVALAYDEPEVIAPGLAFAAAPLLGALAAPIWVFYRRMDFVRQRLLQAIDPVLGFVVTIGLAVAGAGYWSLVIGMLVGSAAGALVIVRHSPYPLRLRFDRATAREYFGFSWPLFLAGVSVLVIAQGSLLAADATTGLVGVAAVTLAATISQYADKVDAVVTETLYPAICAVRDRADLLFESFVKSNRLALMWGLPFGLGLALFTPDLVRFALGEQWLPAVFLIQVFGFNAAINHIGFNWNAFYRAHGRTVPIAVVNAVTMVAFLAAPLPLLLARGLDGYAIGMVVMTVATLAARAWFLTRLFPARAMARHALRSLAAAAPPVAAVLGMRALEAGAARTPAIALAELAVYLAVTVAATFWLERPLLREVVGYLRRPVPLAAGGTGG
jgi:O-antigen/teichoic acid export membrane protein